MYNSINLLPLGFVPMILTIRVSPSGRFNVRIVTSNGEEDIVNYTISDTKSSGKRQ